MELPSRVLPDSQNNETFGEFVVEPFEQGFGITVGNSLRRVLLSSLEGSAITSMKIRTNGGHVIPSEISSIPGILEDTVEIGLNIKSIIVRANDDKQHVLRIEMSGKDGLEVKASDIVTDGFVEVINPDLHIATLNGILAEGSTPDDTKIEDVRFDVELVVENGRGYVPVADAMNNRDRNEDIGSIPLDASFSPVTRVQYLIEPARVGQKTTYDRLILRIWTDGSVRPEWALVEAAKILRKHLNPFVQDDRLGSSVFNKGQVPQDGGIDPFREERLARSISELKLSVRAMNSLEAAGIRTVRDLVTKSEDDILNLKNLGQTTLDEIKEKLKEDDLNLGMRIQ